jgi:hypothetical protein
VEVRVLRKQPNDVPPWKIEMRLKRRNSTPLSVGLSPMKGVVQTPRGRYRV